jgi:hypothetical protein
MSRSRLKRFAGRPLEFAETAQHDGHERRFSFRERGKAVERPGAHERIRAVDDFTSAIRDAVARG